MPMRPSMPCVPGCPNIRGQCEKHPYKARKPFEKSQGYKRITGRPLQQIRKDILTNEPFCRLCKKRLATIVDHIVNLKAGGLDVPENRQPVCATCHLEKTTQESLRGRGLAR